MDQTIIVIEITLILQAFSCLPLVQAAYKFLRISPEVLIQKGHVLIVHGNENPFNHILICISLFRVHNMKQLILVEVIQLI